MECPKKKCKGRMVVTRSVAGKGFATQERVCDKCGHPGTYRTVSCDENVDARTMAKRLADKLGD